MPLPNCFLFYDPHKVLMERDAHPEERGFLYSLWENPDDLASRLVYIDWLRDNGREYLAHHVEKGNTPAGIMGVTSGFYRHETDRNVYQLGRDPWESGPVGQGSPVPSGTWPYNLICGSMQHTMYPPVVSGYGCTTFMPPVILSGMIGSGEITTLSWLNS